VVAMEEQEHLQVGGGGVPMLTAEQPDSGYGL
jgi:hypothetical protein